MSILKLSTLLLFAPAIALSQPTPSSSTLDSVAIEAAKPGDQVATLGVLPDGHIYFRNVSPRKIIATADTIGKSFLFIKI